MDAAALRRRPSDELSRTIDLTQMISDAVDSLDDMLVRFKGKLYVLTPYKPSGKIPPVPKRVLRGEQGGLYYVTDRGTRVYLKAYQRRQCRSPNRSVAGYQGSEACRNRRVQRVPPSRVVARPFHPDRFPNLVIVDDDDEDEEGAAADDAASDDNGLDDDGDASDEEGTPPPPPVARRRQ